MNSPKISVIVPIYKVEKYLVQCIDSIVNQTLKDIEIILVDEGDMDACRYIIDHYEQTDSRVKAIHEKNGGYGASVNKGFDIATGEYLSIIESDDFIEPTMFEEMYNYAKKLDADVVKTPYYEYWDETKDDDERIRPCFWQKWVKEVPENRLFSIKEQPIFMGIHPSVWSCIYKKSYFDRYNIRFLEDKGAYVDHHFKVLSLLNTVKIAWLNRPFYKYRLSNVNASASNFNLPVMIKRWNEFHKLMQEKYPDRYSEFAKYNFREEYVNTFEKLLFDGYKITEQNYNLLCENLSYTTKEQIANAKNINKFALCKMLKLKKNIKLLRKYISSKTKKINTINVIICKMNVLSIKETKERTSWMYLFGSLPVMKIKNRINSLNKIYLFGLIPIIEIKGVL